MSKKRGMWIGIYVLSEVFAFMAYVILMALVSVYENSGLWTAGQP